MTAAFRRWVANTVHDVSGIWTIAAVGEEAKCSLTSPGKRVFACQAESAVVAQQHKQATVRNLAIVTTNKNDETCDF